MAIKQLSHEQIRSMSLEEKDTWWLHNVYRGDAPQLTIRSALTGMILGSVLALPNLYISARAGWLLGVGVTSVILSFALWKALAKLRIGREMGILENNAMQSIATSAGYVTQPLTTSFAAYSMVTGQVIPTGRVYVWLILVAIIGVLFAFPMKKRFINHEQLAFPDGMAAAVVMDALHESDEKDGLFKAKLLLTFSAIAAFIELVRDQTVMRVGFALRAVPAYWDDFLYGDGAFAAWLKARSLLPKIGGHTLRDLGVQWDTSIIFVAIGTLTGIRVGASMLVGAIFNYCVLAPMLIDRGVIKAAADGTYGFNQIEEWSVWGGVACLTTSSLYAFLSRPKVILDALSGLFRRRGGGQPDPLAHIELPLRVSLIGVPFASAALVYLGTVWFDIPPWLGVIGVPLVFVFSLIAVNATGLTSITPTGALGKLTQLAYGALAPNRIITNVMTASITAEVTANAANLLMDIKPGYMLGAKPRQQAVGHLLGAVAGLALSVPVWNLVFVHGDLSLYGTDKLPVPSAVQWKVVAEVLMGGLSKLHSTERTALVVGAIIGLVVEVTNHVSKDKLRLSAVGLGLGFLISFQYVWAIFLGSLVFWLIDRKTKRWEKEPAPKKPWFALASENRETISGGVIAGGALMAVLVNVLDVLVIPETQALRPVAPLVTKAAQAARR